VLSRHSLIGGVWGAALLTTFCLAGGAWAEEALRDYAQPALRDFAATAGSRNR